MHYVLIIIPKKIKIIFYIECHSETEEKEKDIMYFNN